MRKWLVCVVAGLSTVALSGQPQPKDRSEAIWIYAVMRMQRQNDYWFKLGDFPRVIQNTRMQAEIFPHNYDIVTTLGWMLENIQDWAGALAVYIKYRESFPNDPEAYYPEAAYYFNKKAFDKVPPLIEPSLKMGSGPTPNSYRILAHSYDRLNLLKDSVRIWKLYLSKQPNDATAKVNLDKVEKKLHANPGG